MTQPTGETRGKRVPWYEAPRLTPGPRPLAHKAAIISGQNWVS